MESTVMTQRGARIVERGELDLVTTPPGTDTWFPLGHGHVLDRVTESIERAGFGIQKQQLALARDDKRFFATLDLRSPIVPGVALAVGVRNSIDKSLPISFCAGNRVFVCDNLAFSSEIVVSRKHTRFGDDRFAEALTLAVQRLEAFRQVEQSRVQLLQARPLTDEQAESMILRSYEKEIISHRLLPKVIQEWREPTYEDFRPRTMWSLYNAYTTAMGDRQRSNPQQFAYLTIALSDWMSGREPQMDMIEGKLASSDANMGS